MQGDRLTLEPLEGRSYRKHFFKLNGLGGRDLTPLGADLLILVGPSMAHDGPCEIWRWANGTREGAPVSSGDLRRVATLPQRDGVDRAEGLAVYEHGDGTTLVLVVFDSPAPERLQAPSSVRADVYRLV